jgi:long-chain fatty acid transport protein
MWLAGGVAFKPVENLTLTADVQYTNWKKIDKITTTYKDTMWNLLMVASGKNITLMNWKDATQIRFGAEYKISPAFAVRAGYYYDPRPAVDETMNILLPNYDFNVLAFGIGYAADGLLLEAGFEYLMGKEISIPLTMLLAMPGVYNMTIVAPNVSISYRF